MVAETFNAKKDVIDRLEKALTGVLDSIDPATPREVVQELENASRSLVEALVLVRSLPPEKFVCMFFD